MSRTSVLLVVTLLASPASAGRPSARASAGREIKAAKISAVSSDRLTRPSREIIDPGGPGAMLITTVDILGESPGDLRGSGTYVSLATADSKGRFACIEPKEFDYTDRCVDRDDTSEILYTIYGHTEVVDPDMLAGWDETFNPLEITLPEPGDVGFYMYMHLPMQEEEGGPIAYHDLVIAFGELHGQPGHWLLLYDGQPPEPRGDEPGPWYPRCCESQMIFCWLFRRLPFIGWFIPSGFCSECADECWDEYPVRDDPCHSCDPWGMSGVLCRFLPWAHC